MTLNYVVILGMGLRLRCIHRLSTKYTFILVSQFLFIEIVGPDGPDLKYLVMGPKLYVEWAWARLMDPTPINSSAILDSNPSKAQFSFMYVELVQMLRRWDIVGTKEHVQNHCAMEKMAPGQVMLLLQMWTYKIH